MAANRKGARRQEKKTEVPQKSALAQALVESGVVNTTVIDGAIHNAEVITEASNTLLTNPMEYIDELSRLSPFWGGVALRVLTNAIGWYAVNTILWDYRKRNKQPQVTSGIDWLNDTIAEIKQKEASEANFKEQGHDTLKFVEGRQMIGAYKYLFMLCTSSGDTTFELPSPSSLYDRMRQNDKDRSEVLAAYETFEMERYKNSPNFAYIEERLKRNKVAQDARATKKAQDEIDHIHSELAAVTHEVFDDSVWMRLPLWAQFKLIRSIHKQVNAAIAAEMEKPADERNALDDLNILGETILLELEAANRTAEVKLAFERNVLKAENHGLITRR